MRNRMPMQKLIAMVMIIICMLITVSCGKKNEKTQITIYAAKSLHAVMEELITRYESIHDNVEIIGCYDSSGTLMTQILESDGTACHLFFSAAQKQMNQLVEAGYVVEDTRQDVVNNQVCLVTYPGSATKVTSLEDLHLAQSMALASGSVPVGKYTRQALVNMGKLPSCDDVSAITSAQVSEAFSGLQINECGNVGIVVSSVSEGSNEIGTVYFSDLYGFEERLVILEKVDQTLTGDVTYPIAVIRNKDMSQTEKEETEAFLSYLLSAENAKVFETFCFEPCIASK